MNSDLKDYLAEYILPVKYAYTLSASDYHTKYAQSQGYKSNVKIDNRKYAFLANYIEGSIYDYCEIGADDGTISLDIINSLKENRLLFNQHIFLDFSKELLNKCEKNVNSVLPFSKNIFIQCDIEKKNNLIQFSNHKKIIFFLGNTLGNVESEDDVLKNINNFMTEDDYLLLGLTLRNSHYYELSGYNNDLFRESVFEYLRILGIKTDAKNYILRYDDIKHTIYCEYILDEDFSFQNILLYKGRKIRCFQSRRYDIDSSKNLFKNNFFRLVETIIDEDSRHVLFLLKKASIERSHDD